MNGIEEVQEHNEFNNLKVEDKLPASASNFDKICRTCLSEQKNQSIFALKYNEISILSLLDSCVSIKVSLANNHKLYFKNYIFRLIGKGRR